MEEGLPPVSLQNPRESKASEASSMAIRAFHNNSPFPLSHPINGLSTVLHCKPLWDVSKWLEIALDQGFNKVASFVLGVSLWHIHHIRLDHHSPGSSIDDLWMEGNDRRVVLKKKIWLKKKQHSWFGLLQKKERSAIWKQTHIFLILLSSYNEILKLLTKSSA